MASRTGLRAIDIQIEIVPGIVVDSSTFVSLFIWKWGIVIFHGKRKKINESRWVSVPEAGG